MKKVFVILLMGAVVVGCSARVGNSKMGTSESKIEKQMVDVKTKSDARKTFGTPNLIFDKNNGETYEYRTVSGAGRYSWIIPIWGWVAPIWQDDYTYRETNLFIAFDKNDKVKNWNIIKTGGTTD